LDERSLQWSVSPERAERVSAKALVARTLTAGDRVCFPCVMAASDLDLTAVLDALRELEVDVNVIRAWGACGRCGHKSRTVLTIR
jgi:hypothetical protein